MNLEGVTLSKISQIEKAATGPREGKEKPILGGQQYWMGLELGK